MKRLIALLLMLSCVLGFAGCDAKTNSFRIIIPAGSQGEFIYSDAELLPRQNHLVIQALDIPEDAQFVLMPIDVTQENAFQCTNFPNAEPMRIEAEKGVWYKIGIAVQNLADKDIIIIFNVENAKVRIE